MTDTHPETPFEPLSTEYRAYLGGIQPWGNPTYLAAKMGANVDMRPWEPNMAPASFNCPCCPRGTVTASPHPTAIGVMTLACDKKCGSTEITAACSRQAPRAFRFSDDLFTPMPEEMVTAVVARLENGTFNPAYSPVMGMVDRMRVRAERTRVDRVQVSSHTIALVLRADWTDDGEPKKAIRQVHAEYTADGRVLAAVGLPDAPWPAVGQDTVADRAGAPILHVEGEKARAAAITMFPDYVVTTTLCGAGNAHHTDWSFVRGREILVLGDNDAAGAAYAEAVAAQAHAAGASIVRIVKLTADLPKGWDVADALPDGVTDAEIHAAVTDAPAVTWEAVKDALKNEAEPSRLPVFRLDDGHLANNTGVAKAIEEALTKIDPGCHRNSWLAVLGSVHHALGTDGLTMCVEWSQRDDAVHGKFRPGEVEHIFETFALQPHPTPMTIVDLFWRAWRESAAESDDGAGWRPSDPAAIADAEIAAFSGTVRKLVHGDNVYIAIEKRKADGRYTVERVSERTAESIFRSRRVRDHDGKKLVSIYKLWELHRTTRPLDLVFRPGSAVSNTEFNEFQGFSIAAKQDAGSYKLFRELVDRISIENGDDQGWLWNCMAYRVQNPDKLMESVAVLVGPQGSGKTTFAKVNARLLAPYSIRLSQADRFVGKNNACLTGKLFVQVEEMVLGRHADWCDTLNNYVTGSIIDVEDKHVKQTQIDNRMWIVMTSNSTDVVRIGKGERRYAMYWVSDRFAGDQDARSKHFGALDAELEAGGYEALMYDLLHHTIPASFDRKAIPHTPLYLELVGASVDADPLPNWWREILESGTFYSSGNTARPWEHPVEKDILYGQYSYFCEQNGPRDRRKMLSKAEWAKQLGKMIPGGLSTMRRTVDGARAQFYQFPPYAECCAEFERQKGVELDRAPDPAQLRSVM